MSKSFMETRIRALELAVEYARTNMALHDGEIVGLAEEFRAFIENDPSGSSRGATVTSFEDAPRGVSPVGAWTWTLHLTPTDIGESAEQK